MFASLVDVYWRFHGFPTMVTACACLGWVLVVIARRRQDDELHCPGCGHILKGLSEPRCPECGRAI